MAVDKDRDLYLNSFYDRENDVLTCIMKDVVNDTKSANKIKGPKIDVYIDTDENNNIYKEFILKKNAVQKQISYRWKEYEVAKLLGIGDFAEKVRSGEMQREFVLMNKKIFGTDINIQDFMIMKYLDNFPHTFNPATKTDDWDDVPPIRNIHIGFMDYEWDIKHTDIKENQPIYMGTYIDGFHNVCYTYYLDRPEYTRCDELKNKRDNVVTEMLKIIEQDIEELHISDPKKKALVQQMMRDRVEKMTFILKPYEKEADLIRDMMQLAIRQYKPDFLLIFNASSDIGQLEMRAAKLRIKPTELFTCPELGDYIEFDYSDTTFNPKERHHVFNCASYTKIMCSENLYYKTRTGDNFASYNLSDTAYREIGFRKLGYGHICDHISDLPYTDYVITYMYNVRDVLLMVFLEDVLRDVEMLMASRFLSRTEYDRVFIPSAVGTNAFYHIALRNGKIQQPNINMLIKRLYTKISKMDAKSAKNVLQALEDGDPLTYQLMMDLKNKLPVEGGLCSDPNKFMYNNNSKGMLSFMDSWILEDVVDMDAKSMYPNNIITSLIAKSTLFGRIVKIGESPFDNDSEIYRYVSALFCKDWVNIGHLYFGLPSMNDILKLRYTITEELKIDFNDQPFLDGVTMSRLTKLNSILKHLFKEKMNQKDVSNINNIKMNGTYIISDDYENNSIKYCGSKVQFKLIDTNNDESYIPMSLYLGVSTDVLGNGVYIRNEESMIKVKEITDEVSCKWDYHNIAKGVQVGGVDLSQHLDKFNKDTLELIKLNVGGVKVDLSPDFVVFNKNIFKGNFVVADEENDISGEPIMLKVFKTDKSESDDVYMCEINYRLALEEEIELEIKQRFLVINYK